MPADWRKLFNKKQRRYWIHVCFYYYFILSMISPFLLLGATGEPRYRVGVIGAMIMASVFFAIRPYWLKRMNKVKSEISTLKQPVYCDECRAAGAPYVEDMSDERKIVGESENGNLIIHC
jgi:hypothetical protein